MARDLSETGNIGRLCVHFLRVFKKLMTGLSDNINCLQFQGSQDMAKIRKYHLIFGEEDLGFLLKAFTFLGQELFSVQEVKVKLVLTK